MPFEKVNEIIKEAPAFTRYTDLAADRLGGAVIYCTDDFFAGKENLVRPGRGIFIADKYTDRGKWMDGWESRRKRTEGHDWAVIKLAAPGIIAGFDIDTNFFLGNHPPHASIEGVLIEDLEDVTDWESLPWKEILPKEPLDPGSHNFFDCHHKDVVSHLRLHIYPDGGVARLKVYGDVFINWNHVPATEEVDLAAAIHGARAVACNDMFFSDMSNLCMPNRGANMGDGWETKRNRTPQNRDWVIIQLATKGTIEKAIVDTCHFKGNYPDSCSLEACCIADGEDFNEAQWHTILPQTKLQADHMHKFSIEDHRLYTHVRLNIFPDGGVSRLRILGKKA